MRLRFFSLGIGLVTSDQSFLVSVSSVETKASRLRLVRLRLLDLVRLRRLGLETVKLVSQVSAHNTQEAQI